MPLKPKTIQYNSSVPFIRKIAVHSPSGGGKTRLSGTLQDVEQFKDVYLLDLDAGTATLQSRGDIDGEEARRAVDVERVLWSFLNKEPETLRYRSLVIDGLSALCKKEFEELTEGKGKEATFKEYGKVATLSIRLIHLIRDLPVTTVINTWTKAFQPKLAGTDKIDPNALPEMRPDIPNGAYNSFMGSCDDVFHLVNAMDKTRYLYTDKVKATDKIIEAKMRDEAVAEQFLSDFGGKMMPIIKNPTFPDLMIRYARAFAPSKQ
jgi:hypothetical protein